MRPRWQRQAQAWSGGACDDPARTALRATTMMKSDSGTTEAANGTRTGPTCAEGGGNVGAAARRVNSGGGRMLQGPIELSEGCWIARCVDPQGALFALQGTRGESDAGRPSESEVAWSSKWGGFASQGRMMVPKPKR